MDVPARRRAARGGGARAPGRAAADRHPPRGVRARRASPTPRTWSPRLRALAAAHDEVELREHDYFSDDELWDYLHGLDVSVLPYRFGTHSGWLEACFDLGTAVVAPSCGFYAEQQPCLTYRHDEDGLDAASLVARGPARARRSARRPRDLGRRRERSAARWPPRTGRSTRGCCDERAARRDHRRRPLPGRRAVRRRARGARLGARRRPAPARPRRSRCSPGRARTRASASSCSTSAARGSATAARADVSMTAPEWLDEHHAYLQLMLRLARPARPRTST